MAGGDFKPVVASLVKGEIKNKTKKNGLVSANEANTLTLRSAKTDEQKKTRGKKNKTLCAPRAVAANHFWACGNWKEN